VSALDFRPMLAGDAVLLALQPSQHFELGIEHREFTMDEGEDLAENGLAWTAYRGSAVVTIAGFREVFPGHAVAWAALSEDVGRDHLAITRFARAQIEGSPYRRIEAIIEASNVRAIRWAELVGLTAAHRLRRYGPEDVDHILFERVQ
jgi:hypothetical protein